MFTPIQEKRLEILKSVLYEIYNDDYLSKYLIFK